MVVSTLAALKSPCLQAQGTPPSLRNAHAAAAIGAGIYIFGGRSGIDIGEGSLNDLHRFDAESATWVEVRPASEAVPPKRSYHAMAAAQGRLYVFGGCGEGSTGRLNDLWEFDLSTATWRQLPSSDAIKASGNRTLVGGVRSKRSLACLAAELLSPMPGAPPTLQHAAGPWRGRLCGRPLRAVCGGGVCGARDGRRAQARPGRRAWQIAAVARRCAQPTPCSAMSIVHPADIVPCSCPAGLT